MTIARARRALRFTMLAMCLNACAGESDGPAPLTPEMFGAAQAAYEARNVRDWIRLMDEINQSLFDYYENEKIDLGLALVEQASFKYPMAGRLLVNIYMLGLFDVPRDRTAAYRYALRAAELGDGDARGMVAVLDLPRDHIDWMTRDVMKAIANHPPDRTRDFTAFDLCLAYLGGAAIGPSVNVYVMIPLVDGKDWFIGTLLGPSPPHADTGESVWECRGGTFRRWT